MRPFLSEIFNEEIHDCHLCKDPVIRVKNCMFNYFYGSLSTPSLSLPSTLPVPPSPLALPLLTLPPLTFPTRDRAVTVMDAMHGFTYTVWLNEQGDGHLSPAPSATKSGPTKFLKLIGQRKSSSHTTRTCRLALDHQCHPPSPRDWAADAPPQPQRRKRLAGGVAGTDITMTSSLFWFNS